jgi:hypothetical protein
MNSEKNVQGGRAFGTEFAVEDEDMLWSTFPAHTGSRLVCSRTKKVLLHLRRCINVDCSRDMATVIFIIESAVDNLVRRDLRIESPIQ